MRRDEFKHVSRSGDDLSIPTQQPNRNLLRRFYVSLLLFMR
jgi:hypothetical protein